MILYHFCCKHSAKGIRETGELLPGRDGFVWLTDLASPLPEHVGLTSDYLTCRRTERRFKVADHTGVIAWADLRDSLRPGLVASLEAWDEARPDHWFVSRRPVPVIVR